MSAEGSEVSVMVQKMGASGERLKIQVSRQLQKSLLGCKMNWIESLRGSRKDQQKVWLTA